MLYGGRIVESGSPKEICRKYNDTGMIKIHLKNGTDTEFPHSAENAQLLCDLISSGQTESIHTTEPDLCSVFMRLTGKEISA